MKHLFSLFFALCYLTSFSQLLNGSFENDTTADLSHWHWTCGATSISTAPQGGGNWSISVAPGNFQGCFPGLVYQKLPSIVDGESFVLSAWAYTKINPKIGIYFGKINNGEITLLAGDTTSSMAWKQLRVESSFMLSQGDTAVVVLSGGSTSGPESLEHAERYFDLIKLEQVSAIESEKKLHGIKVYPNPFSSVTTIYSDLIFNGASLKLFNATGQIVHEEAHIYGQSYTLVRNNLPSGLYMLQVMQKGITIGFYRLLVVD
ncbi:MAG: T9SS type A sorting domain-containing protein [Saprospiraceae bacterium]|nr:T9SS type A sorting domain-containing protein [Saprospiraceae bacterium]